MNSTANVQPSLADMIGTTASGIGSASQLVELTPFTTLRVDLMASPQKLFVSLVPRQEPQKPLMAAEYPILAEIWDNDEDGIFDIV